MSLGCLEGLTLKAPFNPLWGGSGIISPWLPVLLRDVASSRQYVDIELLISASFSLNVGDHTLLEIDIGAFPGPIPPPQRLMLRECGRRRRALEVLATAPLSTFSHPAAQGGFFHQDEVDFVNVFPISQEHHVLYE